MIPTTNDQFYSWINVPEGTNFEFKEAKNRYDFEKLVKYCVALANEGGGKVILGVTDTRPRRIVGTKAFAEPGRTEAGLHERLFHRIPVEEMTIENKRVLIIHVPSRSPGSLWQYDGRFLKRAGDELAALTSPEIKDILLEAGPDFSCQVCPGSTLDDLSSDAIGLFKKRWSERTQDLRKKEWSDHETLINAELIVDDGITYAALIMFGTHSALGRHLAQAEVIFEYKSSNASGPAEERIEFREGFFLWQQSLWEKINLRNSRQSYQEGLFRRELWAFDEISIREAVLNAVTHRSYIQGGSIFIRQFPHRIEITSPGGLPNGITTENILEQQNPRNRRLAEAFSKCGLIERSGQGINLMFESAIRQGKNLPNFEGTSKHEVRLTLDGAVRNPQLVRFMEKIGEETLSTFSTYDFLTLDCLSRDQPLSEPLKQRLSGLIRIGVIESIGRGKGTKYILSRDLYAALGAQGVHTRKRGLDWETNKALLEKHLRLQGKTGAPLNELKQVLPSVSTSGIQRLLHELRDEGRIILEGQRRWARWKITTTKI